jgi:uncharacterized protein
MAVDHIRYDLLTQEALRGVVRQVLIDAGKNGLPGDHHFYISFYTQAEGVRISPRLREQYPQEITIILQHQFWDLVVRDDHFEVGLSFGGVPERLVVPFAAIKGFFDPSVQFGLQFETIGSETAAAEPAKPDAITDKPQSLPAEAAPAPAAAKEPALKVVESGDDKDPGGAEVVRLDRFRKK